MDQDQEQSNFISKSFFSAFVRDISSADLPSDWQLTVTPEHKQLTFYNVINQAEKKVKALVLSETPENAFKVAGELNFVPIEIPHSANNISTVEELSDILNTFDSIQLCKYYSEDDKENQCLIHSLPFEDVCGFHKSGTKIAFVKKWLESETNTQSDDKPCDVNPDEGLSCCLCQDVFKSKEVLTSHENGHFLCYDNGQFKCTICSTVIDNINAVLQHYKDYHAAVKFLRCAICSSQFCNEQLLKRHVWNHTKFKHLRKASEKRKHSYMCTVCKKRYSTKRLLDQHQKEHKTRDSHACQKCNRKFTGEEKAAVHMQKCKRGNLKYSCRYCGQKFACISQNMCHIKTLHSMLYSGLLERSWKRVFLDEYQ